MNSLLLNNWMKIGAIDKILKSEEVHNEEKDLEKYVFESRF